MYFLDDDWSGSNGEVLTVDLKEYYWNSIKIIAKDRNDGEKIIYESNVKPDEFVIESIHVEDTESPKRKAYWGETLYLVKHEEVEAKVKAKGMSSLFESPVLDWKTKTQYAPNDFHTSTMTTHKNVYSKKYESTAWPKVGGENTHSITAVNTTNNKEYGVNIKTVKYNKKSVKILPPAIDHQLKSTYEKVNVGLKKVKKVIKTLTGKEPKKIEVKPLKVKGEQWNVEDDNSRFYKIVERGSIEGGIVLQFNKFTFSPGFLKFLDIPTVTNAGMYLETRLDFLLYGSKREEKLFNQDTYLQKEFSIRGETKGCLQGGLEFEILRAKETIEFEVRGFAEACLSGQLTYNFTKEKFDGKLQLDPLILGAKVVIKTKGAFEFTAVDWEGKINVTDPIVIYESE